MIQRGQEPGFTGKTGPGLIVHHLGRQALDSNRPLELRIVRQVEHAHRPASQLSLNPEWTDLAGWPCHRTIKGARRSRPLIVRPLAVLVVCLAHRHSPL